MMNQKTKKSQNSQIENNPEANWNQSQLFYQFLFDVDMDYKDAYYSNDYRKMYKAFKIKLMRTRAVIKNYATKEELNKLYDQDTIKKKLALIKPGDSDYTNQFNNDIIETVLEIIEKKMNIIDDLMTASGMNILLKIAKDDRPAAFGGDDW